MLGWFSKSTQGSGLLAVAIEPGLELRPFTVEGWLEGMAKEIEATPPEKADVK